MSGTSQNIGLRSNRWISTTTNLNTIINANKLNKSGESYRGFLNRSQDENKGTNSNQRVQTAGIIKRPKIEAFQLKDKKESEDLTKNKL